MRILAVVLAVSGSILSLTTVRAQEVDAGRIRRAVERALDPIQIGLEAFNDSKPTIPQFPSCVACHHESLGASTLAVVRGRGFEVDGDLGRREADQIYDLFAKMKPAFAGAVAGDAEARKKADPFGDSSSVVGHLVGALVDQGRPRDEVTEVLARYLLWSQGEDGRWAVRVLREPMQASEFAATAMAVRVIRKYAADADSGRAGIAVMKARAWLRSASPSTTDDTAFRLLGLLWADAGAADLETAISALRTDQREDGGWSQLPGTDLGSDAYATGLALFALNRGGVPADDPAVRRGVAYLLRTQAADGTWHVKKRATAYQRYFDAGFPYGEDQYISLAGTCWATMALSLAAEPRP